MFIITIDKIDSNSTGVCGPRSITDADAASLRQVADGHAPAGVEAIHFKMYDDDGEHYYSGYWVARGDADELEPLDCFGAPMAGCTMIKTRREDGRYLQV